MQTVPAVEKHHNHWWVPPFAPHWEEWIGEYETKEEAEAVRKGLERTINTPDWVLMMAELESDFDEQWTQMLRPEFHGGSLEGC